MPHKKDKINVYILASPHPQFDEILDFPPEGVVYSVDRIKSSYHGWFTEKKIALHNLLLKFLPIPRMTHVETNADLIHSTRGILQINPKKPWIIDCESGGVFTSFNYSALKNPLTKRKPLLLKNAERFSRKAKPQKKTSCRQLTAANSRKK